MTTARPGPGQRVAVCCDAPYWGGAETVLRRVVERLVEDWQVVVIATDAAVLDRLVEDLPCERVLLPPVRTKLRARRALAHLRAVRAAGVDAALVNLRQPYAAQYLTSGALLLARVPVVAVEHLPVPSRSALQRRLKRWTASRLSAHVCVGGAAARTLERQVGLPADSVATVRNGVPWVERPPLPLPPGLPRPCLTWVGRLVPQKGLDVLVAALAELPGVGLWVDGEGELRGELEEQVRALGLQDRVALTGWGPDPRGVLASADVIALCSRQEAWALTGVEALQAGRPVVVSDIPEFREMMLDAADFVPVDDPTALADALRALLADPERRADRAAAALRRAAELPTPADMADSYAALLRESVLAGPGRRLPRAVTDALPAAPGRSRPTTPSTEPGPSPTAR